MENFPNPPAQEAILDIFTTLPSETTLDVLKGFGDAFKARLPERHERINLTSGLEFKGVNQANATTTSQLVGYLFRSPTEQKAVQARNDGFTFNKLKPYEGWAKFSGEAKELWKHFQVVSKPILISRIGLRYVNRIEIPFPFEDFRDYCLLFPDIPAKMPRVLSSFFMNFSSPIEEIPSAAAVINITFQPPALTKPVLPLILDIGVSQPLEVFPASDEGIWDKFESLRAAKNRLFDSSLTEAAKQLFR